MPIAFYSGGSLHFQHQNWLGTKRVQTSYNGAVEATYQSLPFGDGYSASGSDTDPYHFAGLDSDSIGTDHAQFRQYSPTEGRWMSPDPYSGSYDFADPQSLNRYAYVTNNPLAFVDPLGLELAVGGGGSQCANNPVCLAMTGGGGGGGVGGMPNDPYGACCGLLGGNDFIAGYDQFALLQYADTPTGGHLPIYEYGDFVGYTPYVYGNTGLLNLLNRLPSRNAGSLRGAPSRGPTVSHCLGVAGQKNGVALSLDTASLGVDAFGPEAQYAKLGIGLGLSTASMINSAAHQDMTGTGLGMASYLKAPTELAATSAGWGWAKWVPFAGAAMDVASAYHDGSQAFSDYSSCMAGH